MTLPVGVKGAGKVGHPPQGACLTKSAFQGAWAKWGVPAGQGPLPGEGAILRPSQRSGPPSFPSSRPTQSFSIKHTFKEF